MQTRANHAQTFRHTPTSVKPLNEAKVAALLDQEWALYKETTKQSGLENNQAKKVLPLGATSSFQHWDPYPLSIVSAQVS